MAEGRSLELIFLPYEGFIDLLGGASWEQTEEKWNRSNLTGKPRHSGELDFHFSSRLQFLFQGDRTSYPLEIFWLKWNLFLGLYRRILKIHQEHKRPLLNLQPDYPRVQIFPTGEPFLPARWGFWVDTSHLTLAEPFAPPDLPSEVSAPLFLPPLDAHPLYAPRLVLQKEMKGREKATVLIRSIERFPDSPPEEVRGLVQIQLVSEHLKGSDSPGDLFQVVLNPFETEGIGEGGEVRIWATKQTSSERGVLLHGVTQPVLPAVWQQFEKVRQKVFAHSEIVIYKGFTRSCDLYSLGMILIRTLLVNDQQGMDRLHPAVHKMAERVGPLLPALDEEGRRFALRRLRLCLPMEGDVFSKKAILYRTQDRENGCEAVRETLWAEALLIGFRLIQEGGKFSREPVADAIDPLLSEAQRLEQRIRLELFGSRERNREILEVCDRIRKEQGEAKG